MTAQDANKRAGQYARVRHNGACYRVKALQLYSGRKHTFRGDNETPPFACTSVHDLDDVNELLLVIHSPVDLVIVTCPKIYHDVLVSEEEHACARVVQFVHRIEGSHLYQKQSC